MLWLTEIVLMKLVLGKKIIKMHSKYRDIISVHPNELARKLTDGVSEIRRLKRIKLTYLMVLINYLIFKSYKAQNHMQYVISN